MNKKPFILSLLLHILLFVCVGMRLNKHETIPIKLEFASKKPNFSKIAEKGNKATSQKLHGYWGIGIYTNALYSIGGNYAGIAISRAIEGYPAAKAGLISGDIIIEVNDEPVLESGRELIAGNTPATLKLKYCRQGLYFTIVLKREFIPELP